MEVSYDGVVEFYDNVSFNIEAANYIDKKLAKSDLVEAHYVGAEEDKIKPPFSQIAGEDGTVATVAMTGGSNGSIGTITAADFIGEDRGAGRRTGIQSFLDNDMVSLMAIPGVTDPNVQVMLVAHCESTGSRFAVLDVPKEAKKVQDIIAHRDIFDSNYAALYHPWLTIFDQLYLTGNSGKFHQKRKQERRNQFLLVQAGRDWEENGRIFITRCLCGRV